MSTQKGGKGEGGKGVGKKKGFDRYLQRAIIGGGGVGDVGGGIQSSKEEEWFQHYVNYNQIKSTIQFYVERRKELERLLCDEEDDEQLQQWWSEEDLQLLDRKLNTSTSSSTNKTQQQQDQHQETSTPSKSNPTGSSGGGGGGSPAAAAGVTVTPTPTPTIQEDYVVEAGDYFRYEDVTASTPTPTTQTTKEEKEKGGESMSSSTQLPIQQQQPVIRPMRMTRRRALLRLAKRERDDMVALLEAEGTKASNFYISQLFRLQHAICGRNHPPSKNSTGNEPSSIPSSQDDKSNNNNLTRWEEEGNDGDVIDIDEPLDPYPIGMELLQLFCFVVVNVITLRQSLIRYDAFARTYNGLRILRGGMWVADEMESSSHDEADQTDPREVIAASSSYASESSLLDFTSNSGGGGGLGGSGGGGMDDDWEHVNLSIFKCLCSSRHAVMEEEVEEGAYEGVYHSSEDNNRVGTIPPPVIGRNDNKLRDRTNYLFHLGPLMKVQETFLQQLILQQTDIIPYMSDHFDYFGNPIMTVDDNEVTAGGTTSTTRCHRRMKTMPNVFEYVEEFNAQLEALGQILDKASTEQVPSFSDPLVGRDHFIYLLRRYFLVGSRRNGLVLEPRILLLRGRHLKKEMQDIAQWRENMARQPKLHRPGSGGVEYGKPNDNKDDDDDNRSSNPMGGEQGHSLGGHCNDIIGTMNPENVVPLLLNLVSCFLFMMNNYVIEPSSAYYANALGSSDALSGIMIGAAPWFALISAVLYSFWTNSTYRRPILFSASLMMVGNILYSTAYTFRSMEMCLIGRAITGLGAPRVINRRYVADATPFHLRTASSAAFATATALGSALGPGTAILLDLFDFTFYIPGLGQQTFNGMTGPGYFMAVCWGVYIVCILLLFKEPTRSGLDELVKRESEASSRVSNVPVATGLTEQYKESIASEDNDTYPSSDYPSSDLNSLDGLSPPSPPVEGGNSPFHCIRHMTFPVAICMFLIFVKRIALESIVASTSIITKNRYGWTIRNVGSLHLLNGIIVIPVTIISGWLSQYKKDRYLALWFIIITLCGMSFLVDITDLVSRENETYNEDQWLAVGPHKYILGSLIAFSGIEACESYVASLMSKVVPAALAVGTFNSGLLATLVGTGGRATGDLFITSMGLISIRNLLNLLIIPGMFLMILSIIVIRWNYRLLAI